MLVVLVILMITQLTLFHLDEYYFHRRRRVTRPEIVSALIDGLIYVLPLTMAIFLDLTPLTKGLYIALSVVSCISIAKNEFYYPKLERQERLVHSFLYVLHPVMLYTFYLSWEGNYFTNFPNFWIVQIIYLGLGVRTLAHQLIYWNYVYTDELHDSHTT
ncbi:MAG: hypothetical protein R2827_07370 [Bdellovibrionales bacterium]